VADTNGYATVGVEDGFKEFVSRIGRLEGVDKYSVVLGSLRL
jgi:hypothetical protein